MFQTEEDENTTQGIMKILSSAMGLLRKCRVNAALTIQLFSQLFHFINRWTFNQIVTAENKNYCTHRYMIMINIILKLLVLFLLEFLYTTFIFIIIF